MSKQELLDRLVHLFEENRRVTFVVPEDTGYFSLDPNLLQKVRTMLRETVEVMSGIMDAYDPDGHIADSLEDTHDDHEFFREIGAEIASHMAMQEVSGLAFVSRGQLYDILDGLERAVDGQKMWKAAALIDAALRRLGRSLVAVETSIRQCEGLPPTSRTWFDLDDALETRNLYSLFRHSILDSESKTLEERLANASRRLAAMREHELYPYLRIDDRLEVRRLQKRILTWRAGAASAEDGERLWQDLSGFAKLLAQINQREELREHDRVAVEGIYRMFFESGLGSVVLGPRHLEVLEPLFGCEDDLDAILLHPEGRWTEDLKEPLERLRRTFSQAFQGREGAFVPLG